MAASAVPAGPPGQEQTGTPEIGPEGWLPLVRFDLDTLSH